MSMPLVQYITQKLRFHSNDFEYARNVWLTTIILGALIFGILMFINMRSDVRSPGLYEIPVFIIFATSIAFICSVPAFFLYCITVMIINARSWDVFWKKSLLMLIILIELAGSLTIFVGRGLTDKFVLLIFIANAVVIIPASFFYKLKPTV
ncbi:hypothetical protein SAMN05428949_0478 [Chitinophaga sp. YR627]|nr:hypothetical protein SAMN05428949_0478 [Chitinophaga sp. YR627]